MSNNKTSKVVVDATKYPASASGMKVNMAEQTTAGEQLSQIDARGTGSLDCPICDGPVSNQVLEAKGISQTTFFTLKDRVNGGLLNDIVEIAEIGLKFLNPEGLARELNQKKQIEVVQSTLLDMVESVRKEQSAFLQQLLETDDADRRKMLEEHVRTQQQITDQYKRDVDEKVEKIRLAEEQRIREYSDLTKSVNEIQSKLFGTTIGAAGEVVTLLDLKRVCPSDEFSETRASKHGTDIVAEVIENGVRCGKVSISVKYTQKWDCEFVSQLTRNLQQDNSRWGLLVTRAFPKEALNTKMWTTRDNIGNLVFMVKPEFAALAYYASRQIAIHWKSLERILASRKSLQEERDRIEKAVIEWLSGEKFNGTLQSISNAMRSNNVVTEGLLTMQTYCNERLRALREESDVLRSHLEVSASALNSLKDLLSRSHTDVAIAVEKTPLYSQSGEESL